MARARITYPVQLFLIYFLLLFTASFSSSHDQTKFQPLDVSGALRQTRQVFSRPPSNLQVSAAAESHQPLGNSSSHALSLTLHPRSSLPWNYNSNNDYYNNYNNNYTHLTLSRLARDEARVRSIFSRSYLRPAQIEAPLISGLSQGSGEYFARIGVGRPVRDVYMIADTGSDVCWLQCRPCTDCYDQSDPIYDPSASATYKALSCDSSECNSLERSGCRQNTCQYQVSYGDGSYTTGNFATETISFGTSGAAFPGVAIGCGHDNEGLFSGAAGLLGLGGGSVSLPSQLHATSFSYCLVNRDSTSASTLDFGSVSPPDSVVAPLVKNPLIDTFWYVNLTGISVGGRPLAIPWHQLQLGQDGRDGVIIDSGTAVTRLPTKTYQALRDAFVSLTQDLPRASGFSLFDTCYNLNGVRRARVPTVSFEFAGGKSLLLPAANYMVAVNNRGKFCLAFAGTTDRLSIIGNVQQQGTRVVYDLANKRIAFSPNKC